MGRTRPPIQKSTETEVLVRSRRRCCLCVFLNGDLSVKQIQIAHLDHNCENNNPENLVALCLLHHDEYDSRRSQSKGIQISEVKYYRGELDKIIQKQDEQLRLPAIGSNNTATPSARLLGRALSAFDNEMQRLQTYHRPNGIALANLGRIAIEEEGEFDVAIEVFISLIRLSTAAMRDSKIFAIRYSVPTATPALGAVEVLHRMHKKDFSLFENTIHRARHHALVGDSPFSSLSDYSKIPDKAFEVITSVLYACCLNMYYPFIDLATRRIAEQLSDLLLGVAFAIAKRGVELPDPSSRRYVDLQLERCVGEDQSEDLLPFVRLVNKIALLPKSLFDLAVSRPNYMLALRHIEINQEEGLDEEEAVKTIMRWATLPFYAVTPPMQVKDERIKEKCVNLINQTNELGLQVSIKTREYILAERENLSKRRKPSQPSQQR